MRNREKATTVAQQMPGRFEFDELLADFHMRNLKRGKSKKSFEI